MNKEELQNLVKTSSSLSDIIRRQGKAVSGTSMKLLKQELDLHQIDYHFMPDKSSKKLIPLEDILVNGSNYQSSKLLQRLISEGLKKNECENPKCPCKNGYWLNNPITYQLHHINGNHYDNRLENLQILCPNCHSQTDNWGSKHEKTKNYCRDCGIEINVRSTYCRKCAPKHYAQDRIKNKPSKEELEKLILTTSFIKIGQKYGVSDNAVRKWCMRYGLPSTKRDLKEFCLDKAHQFSGRT